MGWFDKLLYGLGQASPIGRAIEGMKQDSRYGEAARAYSNAPDLSQFSAIQTPDNIYDPKSLAALETLKKERLGILQKQDAAPVERMINNFIASGNDADPNFTGQEWVKGMATTPALGGTMEESQYDALNSGAIPSSKKGGIPVSQFAANPVTADLLQKAEIAAQQKGTLARIFGAGRKPNPMDLATIGMSKELAGQFDNTTQGGKRLFDQFVENRKIDLQDAVKQAYLNTPVVQTPESASNFDQRLIEAGGIEFAAPYIKHFDSVNTTVPVPGQELNVTVGNGPNSTIERYQRNLRGEIIPGTSTSSTNNPSDKERGISGGSDKKEAEKTEKAKHAAREKIRKLELQKAKIPQFDGQYDPDTIGLVTTLDSQIEDLKAEYDIKDPAFPASNGKHVAIDDKRKPIPASFQAESKTMPGYWRDANGLWWDSKTKRPR